jgi:hypothetical protein
MAAAAACHVALLTDHSKRLVPGENWCCCGDCCQSRAGEHGVQLHPWFFDSVATTAGQIASIGRGEIWLHGDIRISVVTNSFE